MAKIKVLIVDDSAVIRQFLTDVLSSSPAIEVIGTSMDAYFAVDKIKNLQPDVLTLDVEMPRMDGLTFLSKLMISHPLPVVMVSHFTSEGSKEAIEALHLGAVDFIQKPKYEDISNKEVLLNFTQTLTDKIIIASKTRVKNKPKLMKEIIPVKKVDRSMEFSNAVIAIGASTGGVAAISDILSGLRDDLPGIIIVQHMPEEFTKSFAASANEISKISIKEAEHGDRIYKGCAFIAPGDRHMLLRKDAMGFAIELNDDEPFGRHRPSVDKLFYSVAEAAGSKSIGILLTGMGEDGARGLSDIREAGAVTIVQDEESSVVFGMPMKAIEIGAAQMVKNIDGIISYLNSDIITQVC